MGTLSHRVDIYQNFGETVDVNKHKRKRRPDYWEVVLHYTSYDNFISIMDKQCIHAIKTGYFKTPAVCMTEVPVKFKDEFKEYYGEYEIAFKKRDIIRAGGGPAVYLLDTVISAQKSYGGFCDTFKPFVNLLRIPSTVPKGMTQKVDFLHEREWRFPKDLHFSDVAPLGIVLPKGTAARKFNGPDGRKLLQFAWKFGEIEE